MKYFLDLEVYTDYFLASFKREDGKIKHFEKFEGHPLNIISIKKLLKKGTFITFNGNRFDMPVLALALNGGRNDQLKKLSDSIIDGAKTWDMEVPACNHIDIKEPSPGVMTSLKIYGGRLNAPKLQDLPIDPSSLITPQQREELKTYCVNDLDTTEMLYNEIIKQIELREKLTEKYGVDMRSKSDAQVAEAIIRQYLTECGVKVKKRQSEVKPFKYRVPDWVKFKSPEFKEMLQRVKDCTFSINAKGSVLMPKELNKAVEYSGAKYKFGIGGLHSQEKKQRIAPDNSQLFGEFDVASMYPSIIIEQELYPKHLTPKFLDVYSTIKNERLTAKRAGDSVKDKTYKIVLNGSYGKFGSKYSFLYSPELLIQTTITGQLSLLMLIEKMTLAGGRVVSANTDGVNVLYSKTDMPVIHNAAFDWELSTGYELEYTPYLATYNRDVNNYLAIKESGVKGKGACAIGGLMKNPCNNVCVEAVISHLCDGSDIETHIRNEQEETKFLTLRRVTGGAVFEGEEIGKAIRFYHSTTGTVITYKKNGNKVPKSDGCRPLMNLDKFPGDLNYQWYIDEAHSILEDLGV